MSRTFVPPSGNLESKIAIIAEQPGKTETRLLQPFVGPAGDNLNECLHNARIARNECYLTNVVKDLDHPLRDYISINYNSHKRSYTFNVFPEGEEYISILKEELHKCSANVLVAAGNIALYALCGRAGITAWRGSVIESTLLPGRKVVPIFHPATYTQEKLHKNPSAYLNKHLISMDLIKVKRESEFPEIKLEDRNLIIKPSYIEAIKYLEYCKFAGEIEGFTIFYDIETLNGELSCISFSVTSDEAICIPFIGPDGDYFNPEQEAEIMHEIAKIMANKEIKKGGQYIIFDSRFLLNKYGIRTYNTQVTDTMIAQKILYPEFKVGLDFITAMWTDIPYYKADGKIWLTGSGSWEQGWQYNDLDSIACADAFPKQEIELKEKGNWETYQRQSRLIEPLTFMMEHGIKVDIEGMEKAYHDLGESIKEKQEWLNILAKKELNPNSPKQLIEYFYVSKGITPYLKDGSLTVDINALKRIARKGFEEASIILEIRGLVKRRSTYLNSDKVDKDGRIRCSYNPVGTKFSRISSGEDIYKRGSNLQNWPMDLRQYLVGDDGYVIYCLDMSQFENRVVAYVGNIQQMIQVFENGLDSHIMTAALIGNKNYESISSEPRSSRLGDGLQSERFWGKKANHAFNYGYGYKNFSLLNEISEKQGKIIYDAYHRVYPGLRSGYWEYVKEELRTSRTLTNLFSRKVTFHGQWGEKLFQEAYSCIPQGTCGDLINERGLNFVYYDKETFAPVELMTQIHDDIAFQIPLTVPVRKHAEMLIAIKESLEQPLRFKDREFIPPADLTMGFTLNKLTGVEFKGDDFSNDVEELEVRLRKGMAKLVINGRE